MDDLFAELDSRNKQETVTESQDTPVNKVEERVESGSRKQNPKMRHLARQVGGRGMIHKTELTSRLV